MHYGVPQGSVLGPVLFNLYTQPLSSLITEYRISHHMYADDSQLYDSESRENISSTIHNMEDCIGEIKVWMAQNKLQLNEDKTEAMLVASSSLHNPPQSITVGQNT